MVLGGLALDRPPPQALPAPGGRRRDAVAPSPGYGAVGLWAAIGLLGLSVTGLTLSVHLRGRERREPAHLAQLVHPLALHPPSARARGHQPPTAAPGRRRRFGGPRPGAGHGAEGGLDGPLEITPPKPGKAYAVKEIDRQVRNGWTRSRSTPPPGSNITPRLDFADYPLAAKLTRYGIDLHMGLAFGLVNQIVLVAHRPRGDHPDPAGLPMWWQRRPTGGVMGPPLHPGRLAAEPVATVVLPCWSVPIGWFIPLFGLLPAGLPGHRTCSSAAAPDHCLTDRPGRGA
ncbi:hypothetical protein GCM10020229_60480 [Kitasatospora albolonga]|uniref:PepSY-associated TM helix domain-containing protein n=1 Tax=Kitasatospora albolonga TaxID=68173 RepID=UPI0033709900